MESSKEDIDNIINELSGNYRDLIKDKNGNYFCSDLFKICNQEQRIKILKELTKTISDDCVNRFGNYPIQTLIEYSACEEEYQLILNSFNDYLKLVYASFDTYGSYVIQKIIEHIPEKFRIKFNLLFITSIPIISFQKFGVCTAKKFISYTKNEDTIEQIVNLIRKNLVKIATNNFGNFLIQYIIKKWNNTIQGNKIKQEIIYNFKTLSNNKYSSYICDFFLKISTREEKIQLFQLLRLESLNNNNFNLSQNYK
jgi:pumilio RNA-binding family